MKWQEPGKNLFFWKKTNKTPYCGIKNSCSAENKSAFFENVLSNDSILKISVHINDIDSGDTLSELDFRPSSKYWSHFTEKKNLQKPISHHIFCYFQFNHLTCTFPDPSILFYNVSGFPRFFLYILCGLQFVESSFWCFYIPCSLCHHDLKPPFLRGDQLSWKWA